MMAMLLSFLHSPILRLICIRAARVRRSSSSQESMRIRSCSMFSRYSRLSVSSSRTVSEVSIEMSSAGVSCCLASLNAQDGSQ